MLTLDDSMLSLYRRGMLHKEEMFRIAEHPEEIMEKLAKSVPENARGQQTPQQAPQQTSQRKR